MVVNFTFVGGCFPVQHNIQSEDLFHQIIKRDIEKRFDCCLNVNIIRFERLATCFDKIKEHKSKNPVDILVFHIRAEPLLRMSKLYYKFLNNEGKLRHSFNLPVVHVLNPEKYDYLVIGRRYSTNMEEVETKLHKLLLELNYYMGFLISNYKFALLSYKKLVKQVISYCKQENVHLILVGPASRPHTRMENLLSEKLHNSVLKSVDIHAVKYINGLGISDEKGESLFFENGKHANEKYHQRIARFITDELVEILESRYKKENDSYYMTF
jgi:hypothetical protein